MSNGVLRLPNRRRTFEIHKDASGYGAGAVLGQRDKDGKAYIVRYMSKKLTEV